MACAEIRNNIRTNLCESRQSKREQILQTKRKALLDDFNIGREITDSEVILLGNKLKSKSDVKVEDLALLKLSFVQSINNIVTFLKVKGALHGLVRELSSKKSNYQLAAAECCCNLALGEGRSSLQVAKAAGPYLIALLSGCNYNLISISIWALGNLVGSDEKTWSVIHSQGFLEKLLQLITEHDTVTDIPSQKEIQQNLLLALKGFLRIGLKLLTAEEIESITKTVSTLKHCSGKNLAACEYLLSSVDAAESILVENKLHINCLQRLDEMELNDETVVIFTPVVRTVANLIAEPSGTCATDVFDNWNIFDSLVQKILDGPYLHLVNELGWLLGNLLNHSSPVVQAALVKYTSNFQITISRFSFFL